jgi:hypothetical protein
MDRRQGGYLHSVENAEDVELPFLGEVRRVGEECEGDMHGQKDSDQRPAASDHNAFYTPLLTAVRESLLACWSLFADRWSLELAP